MPILYKFVQIKVYGATKNYVGSIGKEVRQMFNMFMALIRRGSPPIHYKICPYKGIRGDQGLRMYVEYK